MVTPKSKILGAHVDLWPTDREASFAIAVARAITESLYSTADKMLETAQQFLSRLLPVITSLHTTPETSGMIEHAIDLLLERENYVYSSLWDSFSLNYRRVLKGLAIESPGVEIFGVPFIKRHHLSTPSSVQMQSKWCATYRIADA